MSEIIFSDFSPKKIPPCRDYFTDRFLEKNFNKIWDFQLSNFNPSDWNIIASWLFTRSPNSLELICCLHRYHTKFIRVMIILSADPLLLIGKLLISTALFTHHFINKVYVPATLALSSINSLTVASLGRIFTCDRTIWVVRVGNHLSPHILLVYPYPTLYLIHSFIRFPDSQILLHICEGPVPILANKIHHALFKVFSFIILATKEFGFVSNLQNCFANMTCLKLSTSLKPNSPWFLEFPTLFLPLNFLVLIHMSPPELSHHGWDLLTQLIKTN